MRPFFLKVLIFTITNGCVFNGGVYYCEKAYVKSEDYIKEGFGGHIRIQPCLREYAGCGKVVLINNDLSYFVYATHVSFDKDTIYYEKKPVESGKIYIFRYKFKKMEILIVPNDKENSYFYTNGVSKGRNTQDTTIIHHSCYATLSKKQLYVRYIPYKAVYRGWIDEKKPLTNPEIYTYDSFITLRRFPVTVKKPPEWMKLRKGF
jgi:hypothetical protein